MDVRARGLRAYRLGEMIEFGENLVADGKSREEVEETLRVYFRRRYSLSQNTERYDIAVIMARLDFPEKDPLRFEGPDGQTVLEEEPIP